MLLLAATPRGHRAIRTPSSQHVTCWNGPQRPEWDPTATWGGLEVPQRSGEVPDCWHQVASLH